jgi:sulfonate dioxygenase
MGHLATKEAFITGPKAFNLEAETKGTAKQPPASHPNYLPVWDNEEGT